ncbi:MAG: peptidoglycan DD-metalloendopeptidase family protein [Anaerolineales bacterium]|nr:peptidoglycan DD-metalloendopeptidase family protein [Anaerolineales bacterium]
MRHFRRCFGVCLAVVGLALRLAATPARAAGEVFVLDVRGEAALVLLLPERALALRTPAGLTPLGLTARAARFLPDGSYAAVSDDLALWRIGADGTHAWLPAGSANAPLFVSPDGARLAFLQPHDLTPGDDLARTNAVAVLDLKTNAVTELFRVEGVTTNLYGWLGDHLLLEVPTWTPMKDGGPGQPAGELVLATLTTEAPNAPQALAALPALAPGSRYPQTSFDQRILAYTSAAGVVVVDLAAARFAVYAGQADPLWTETGLSAVGADARAPLAWAAADLQAAPALSGPAALPNTTLETGAAFAGPAATEAIYVYRPVRASTRVSAYYDLDRNLGTISDWLGYVGTQWIYGRAYDQHSGTDYDGVTNDPVYAPAPGHVYAVYVDCANTYPNGPGSFGSYVLIEHGAQSDGASYRTLVGHLKCTGYFIGEGADINRLPTQVGQMGNTGYSTGDHTHLQVYRNGTTIDPYSRHIISDTPPESSVGGLQGLVRTAGGQPAPGVPLKLLSNNIYRTTVSDGEGRYTFSDVPLGAVTLTGAQGLRWGRVIANVVGGQTLAAPDLVLDQCGGAGGGEGCPARTYDAAAFSADVTVPDDSVWGFNQPLTKTWRLQNTGTSVWGAGYELVFVAGDQRGNPPAIGVPTTGPGFQADLSTTLTTPGDQGRRRGYWRLRNDEGVFFGPLIWVELNTAPAASASRRPLTAAGAPTCAVQALPAVSPGAAVTVSWAGSGGNGALKYEVQYRDSGRGAWYLWFGATAATSGGFAGQTGHTYAFRCRATDAASLTGSYPTNGDTFTTLGDQSGQPDLRIVDLTVAPNAAGGLWARATIQNEGSASTQRGFYADLYLGTAPTGPFDFTNSVYMWVNEPLAAGATRTLEAPVTTSGAQGTVMLFAQVDSTGAIAESDEGDNIWNGGVSGCLAPEDGYEDDNIAAAARFLPFGSQARTIGGPGDEDWGFVGLQGDHLYSAETSGLAAGLDTRLRVYANDAASLVLSHDDVSSTNLASALRFVPPHSGTYYFQVTDWNPGTGGCSAGYTFTLTDLGLGWRILLPLGER